MYEIFEHTADLGLRIRADSRESLFAEAARGLFSLIVVNLDDVQPVQEKTFQLEGGQLDYLLFDWLNELLYTCETEHLLLGKFEVSFNGAGLTAIARGEPIDPDRHELDHEVKAITYHGLKVVEDGGRLLAEVIVDI